MSKEKHIEEVKDLNLLLEDITVDKVLFNSDGEAIDVITVHAVDGDVTNILANILYNAGYRKQSKNTIELPCNIGDSCYPLPRYRTPIVERKVSRITFTKRNVIIGYYENDGQYRPPLRTRTLGDDVFLTKEEAEAKLKELKK